MTHTHTIEIVTANQTLIGEISFNGGKKPSLTTESTIDCSLDCENWMHNVLNTLVKFNKASDGIEKIEIVKKV